MLVLCLLAGLAWADTIVSQKVPVTTGTPESEKLPMPSGSGDGYIAPSKDVPLYVPLTDERQEAPIAAGAEVETYDYATGVERPASPPAAKVITDQVPAH